MPERNRAARSLPTTGSAHMRGCKVSHETGAKQNGTSTGREDVEELRAVKNDPDSFRDMFGRTLAMVLVVGSIIDHESIRHTTPKFVTWWKQTQDNPLRVFLWDARNAEFKQGERRQRATHHVSTEVRIRISSSIAWEHRDKDGRVVGRNRRWDPPVPGQPSPIRRETVIQSTDWYFEGEGKTKGGAFDGEEVFTLLDRYLAWLRDDLLPMAERLTE